MNSLKFKYLEFENKLNLNVNIPNNSEIALNYQPEIDNITLLSLRERQGFIYIYI